MGWLRTSIAGLSALLGVHASAASAQTPAAPIVLAAASMQEAITDAAERWAAQGHPRPVVSFASSSALARQIAAGAPADLFISADAPWMDDIERRGLLSDGSRAILARNRLVVVSRKGAPSVAFSRGDALVARLGAGPLAMADPDSVPAGRYGKAALEKLGAWARLAPKVVRAENVRAALALVERGAAPYGIVYATDALASDQVVRAGVFPARSHPPIVYPIAQLKRSTNPEAAAFRGFLLSSAGTAILKRRGFQPR